VDDIMKNREEYKYLLTGRLFSGDVVSSVIREDFILEWHIRYSVYKVQGKLLGDPHLIVP
jgi:hypothetical protein